MNIKKDNGTPITSPMSDESVSEDAQADELKRWYRNYSKYSNLNGDKLPFGLYMQLAQTGVPTDGMAAHEASKAIQDANLSQDVKQDALSGGTIDTGIDFDKVDQPISNAMKQELADIMGVDAIGEEEITKAMKMLGVTTGMESAVQEDADKDRAIRFDKAMRSGQYEQFADILSDAMHFASVTNKDFERELQIAKDEFEDQTNEDAAGVGIITKQNTTADVKPGDEYKNVKKLGLKSSAYESKLTDMLNQRLK